MKRLCLSLILTALYFCTVHAIANAQQYRLSKNLSVLSYNIKGLPDIFSGDYDQDRYADIGRILSEKRKSGKAPDIVLLQESFVSRTKELRDLAGYPHESKGPNASTLLGVDSGLYILSNYPIIKTDQRSFGKICESWDCYANKGVQLARIQIPNFPYPLDVYNTHMQASSENEATRKKQIEILVDFVKQTHHADNPIIFGGDFNFRPLTKESAYHFFQERTSLLNAAENRAKWNWKNSVDHHFFGKALSNFFELKPVSVDRPFEKPVRGRRLSDHLGLEAIYELIWPSTSP